MVQRDSTASRSFDKRYSLEERLNAVKNKSSSTAENWLIDCLRAMMCSLS